MTYFKNISCLVLSYFFLFFKCFDFDSLERQLVSKLYNWKSIQSPELGVEIMFIIVYMKERKNINYFEVQKQSRELN